MHTVSSLTIRWSELMSHFWTSYAICTGAFIGGSFDDFQKECGVYYLHRQVLNSYYETGECFREETVLLNEVAYEQRRMTMAIADMLKEAF